MSGLWEATDYMVDENPLALRDAVWKVLGRCDMAEHCTDYRLDEFVHDLRAAIADALGEEVK